MLEGNETNNSFSYLEHKKLSKNDQAKGGSIIPTKKVTIGYWFFTGLLIALMLLGSIPDIMSSPSAVALFKHLGYPAYLLPFIGIAKFLGVISALSGSSSDIFRRRARASFNMVISCFARPSSRIAIALFRSSRELLFVFIFSFPSLNLFFWRVLIMREKKHYKNKIIDIFLLRNKC